MLKLSLNTISDSISNVILIVALSVLALVLSIVQVSSCEPISSVVMWAPCCLLPC